MKKSALLVVVFMGFCGSKAGDRDITLITGKQKENTLRHKCIINDCVEAEQKLPLLIGNKTFWLDDLKNLTDEQKNLLFRLNKPHCCLVPCGVDNTHLRPQDIEALKNAKMPAYITDKLDVFVIRQEPVVSYRCLGISTALACMAPLVAGGVTALFAVPQTAGGGCIWPTLWAGIGQMMAGGAITATCGCAALIQLCVCRDKDWYEFNAEESEASL